MFEKEAEESAKQNCPIPFNWNEIDIAKQGGYRKGFKDGAEFGYNKAKVEVEDSYRESLCNSELNLASVTEQLEELEKANEWHFVKDGDLPSEDLPKELFAYYYKDAVGNDCFGFMKAEYLLCGVEKWFEANKQIIAWKEIVLPKLPKESE